MAVKLTRKQRKELKDKCLTESTLRIWLEIGGIKRYQDIWESPQYQTHTNKRQLKNGSHVLE